VVLLHHLVTRCLFGQGLLHGTATSGKEGYYTNTTRGRVHYAFFRRSDASVAQPTEVRRDSDASEGSFDAVAFGASTLPGPMPLASLPKETLCSTPLVVLVHGYAGSMDVFVSSKRSGYVAFLQQNGFNVLAFDLYGAGRSDGPDTTYSSELFVEQLADLCLKFGICKPFHLLGFSMGGSVALQFAHRFPELVDRLILQAPHITETPLQLSLRITLCIPIFREVVAFCILPFIGECKGSRAAVRACFRLLLTRSKGGGRWSSPGNGGSTLEALTTVVEEHQRMVHVIWGESDKVVHYSGHKIIQSLVPSANIRSHPGANHMSFADGDPAHGEFFRSALLECLTFPEQP